MTRDLDALRATLLDHLPEGRDHAVSARYLARVLGTNTRTIGQLVEQAILVDGACIGSLCGERHGYFLIQSAADLEAGVGHTVKRLANSARRVRAVRRNYEALPSSEQTSLFADLEAAMAS